MHNARRMGDRVHSRRGRVPDAAAASAPPETHARRQDRKRVRQGPGRGRSNLLVAQKVIKERQHAKEKNDLLLLTMIKN